MVFIFREPHHQEELVCFALDSVGEMLKNCFPKERFLFNIFHQLQILCLGLHQGFTVAYLNPNTPTKALLPVDYC